MRNKYKIIGKYWDEQHDNNHKTFNTIPFDVTFTDHKTHASLFDIEGSKKKICSSEILDIKDETSFKHLSKNLRFCKTIALVMDLEGKALSPIALNYYYKRLNDVGAKTSHDISEANVVMMKESEDVNY